MQQWYSAGEFSLRAVAHFLIWQERRLSRHLIRCASCSSDAGSPCAEQSSELEWPAMTRYQKRDEVRLKGYLAEIV